MRMTEVDHLHPCPETRGGVEWRLTSILPPLLPVEEWRPRVGAAC